MSLPRISGSLQFSTTIPVRRPSAIHWDPQGRRSWGEYWWRNSRETNDGKWRRTSDNSLYHEKEVKGGLLCRDTRGSDEGSSWRLRWDTVDTKTDKDPKTRGRDGQSRRCPRDIPLRRDRSGRALCPGCWRGTGHQLPLGFESSGKNRTRKLWGGSFLGWGRRQCVVSTETSTSDTDLTRMGRVLKRGKNHESVEDFEDNQVGTLKGVVDVLLSSRDETTKSCRT